MLIYNENQELLEIDISNILLEYRKSHHLSVEKMSELLNVTPITYHRWEKGTRIPRIYNINSISQLTGIIFLSPSLHNPSFVKYVRCHLSETTVAALADRLKCSPDLIFKVKHISSPDSKFRQKTTNKTICWDCVNAVPSKDGKLGCSWSKELKPVLGATTRKTILKNSANCITSFEILQCPNYIQDSTQHNPKKKIMYNYATLCDAIIYQACTDYKKNLEQNNNSYIHEVENFFRSNWFKNLTELNGEYLIRKIREEYENENH